MQDEAGLFITFQLPKRSSEMGLQEEIRVFILHIADKTAKEMKERQERDPRLALDTILKGIGFPVGRDEDSLRTQVLKELGERGQKRREKRKRLGLPPMDTTGLFPTSLLDDAEERRTLANKRGRKAEGSQRKQEERNHGRSA